MSAAFASNPWSASPVAWRGVGWRFGRELRSPLAWSFELRRKVAITPKQLGLACGTLIVLSLAPVAGLCWPDLRVPGLFATVELALAAIALRRAVRHAGDRELIMLTGREISVEQRVGPAIARTLFRAEWVRVEPAAADGSLVEISGQGRRVQIGRHLRPELRVELAQELRRALRLARGAGRRVMNHELEA